MAHFKKMALVEPRLLESLQHYLRQQQQIKERKQDNIVDDALTRQENAMQNTLQDPSLAATDKVKLYNDNLQRYLTYREKIEPPKFKVVDTAAAATAAALSPFTINDDAGIKDSTTTDVEHDFFEREIIKSAPVKMKRKAILLLERLKRDPNISWNERGEAIIKGQLLPNTNINDLVQDVLRKRKSHVPRGWEAFAQSLRESNIPQDLVGNSEKWNWMTSDVPSSGKENRGASSLSKFKRKRKRVIWTPY